MVVVVVDASGAVVVDVGSSGAVVLVVGSSAAVVLVVDSGTVVVVLVVDDVVDEVVDEVEEVEVEVEELDDDVVTLSRVDVVSSMGASSSHWHVWRLDMIFTTPRYSAEKCAKCGPPHGMFAGVVTTFVCPGFTTTLKRYGTPGSPPTSVGTWLPLVM